MSKVIKNKGGIGVGAPYDLPGYEYDPVNDVFKDLATGKIFTKDYVAPTGGAGTVTPTVKLEDNRIKIIDASQYVDPVEVTPSQGKDAMKKVTVTVSNIPQPSDLESNKAASIDVSQYTEPVVITPTEGKDGMEQTTVTLTNIPSGGSDSVTLYAWTFNAETRYFNFSIAPASSENIKMFAPNSTPNPTKINIGSLPGVYEKISDTQFKIDEDGMVTYGTRDTEHDFVLCSIL